VDYSIVLVSIQELWYSLGGFHHTVVVIGESKQNVD